MKSGLPPSSHAFVRGTAALETERGNLRESLGGLRNLAQLLHSLRVGSRPLSNVLPAARDACDPLRQAMVKSWPPRRACWAKAKPPAAYRPTSRHAWAS